MFNVRTISINCFKDPPFVVEQPGFYIAVPNHVANDRDQTVEIERVVNDFLINSIDDRSLMRPKYLQIIRGTCVLTPVETEFLPHNVNHIQFHGGLGYFLISKQVATVSEAVEWKRFDILTLHHLCDMFRSALTRFFVHSGSPLTHDHLVYMLIDALGSAKADRKIYDFNYSYGDIDITISSIRYMDSFSVPVDFQMIHRLLSEIEQTIYTPQYITQLYAIQAIQTIERINMLKDLRAQLKSSHNPKTGTNHSYTMELLAMDPYKG